MKQGLGLLISLGYCTFSQGLFLKVATAQVTPDGTTNTLVDVDGNNFTIEQGDRAGGNLFHSFGEFSVPTDGSAFFNNSADIINIFSRVTGGNISDINGVLGANGTANLYLINPAGIIFGETSRLNIGGSFFVSTADSLIFPDGEFSATNLDNPPLLTINAPIGLNLRDNPGDIVNRSNLSEIEVNSFGIVGTTTVGLEVNPGKDIVFIGGNISLENGGITARSGDVFLGGVSSSGIVQINSDGSFSFPENITKADINLNNSSNLDVRGIGGGNIMINARNFNHNVGELGISSIRAGIIANSISADAQAGNITINTSENVNINNSIISNEVLFGARGNAGEVIINTNSLSVVGAGLISTGTFGQGNAGSLIVNAKNNINIDSEGITGLPGNTPGGLSSAVFPGALGGGGFVRINTESLSLTNGGQISASTFGQGNAGSVDIVTENKITIDGENAAGLPSGAISQVFPGAVGNGGDVNITTESLSLANGGQISASTLGQGNAGSININVNNRINIDGENLDGLPGGIITDGTLPTDFSTGIPSSISSAVFPGAIGEGGFVRINTDSLSLTNGGQIAASTLGQGNAGLVTITARDQITIDGESFDGIPSNLSTGVFGQATGNSGGIRIESNSLTLTNGGVVLGNTLGPGIAGDIIIRVKDSITINGSTQRNRSGILSNAFINNGNGGDINVFTNKLSIDSSGTIEVGNIDSLGINATGTGQPGNINIQVNSLELTNEASINAATQSETGNTAIINLQVTEDIILRDNTFISARALENANGGTLDINARFIIGFPSNGNGNDIIATAERGEGGNITINARQVFNLQEGKAIDSSGNFFFNNNNDIDASSQAQGLDGTVTIRNPDSGNLGIDTEIPTNLIESVETYAQACQRARALNQQTGLTLKGKGGVPPAPTETFDSDLILVDELINPANIQTQSPEIKPIKTSMGDIYPARGIIKTEDGKIILTAYTTDNLNTRTPHNSANCNS